MPHALHCLFCDQNHGRKVPAAFLAAQSEDQGKTIDLVLVCDDHADGWDEGADWHAPMYLLTSYATDGKCHNVNAGTFGHECGKPSTWLGLTPKGFASGFCITCRVPCIYGGPFAGYSTKTTDKKDAR